MVTDLNMDVEIIPCPIVREDDGLAKSSRNTYLSAEERKAALILSQAIFMGQQMVVDGERDGKVLAKAIADKISSEPMARIDYVEVVDALTMQAVSKLEGTVLTAIAVYIGKTRLIDNFMITI